MPLGHLNALFIQDANKLERPDTIEVIDEAIKQSGFILWDRPGWHDDKNTRYPLIHKELIEKQKIHGIEVFNDWESYPKVIGVYLGKFWRFRKEFLSRSQTGKRI